MAARTVVFILAVDAEGIVRDVELQPPTGDRRYDAALRRMALDWRFKPARDAANRPVAVKYPVTLTI
jgi:TonB family protein